MRNAERPARGSRMFNPARDHPQGSEISYSVFDSSFRVVFPLGGHDFKHGARLVPDLAAPA